MDCEIDPLLRLLRVLEGRETGGQGQYKPRITIPRSGSNRTEVMTDEKADR